MFRPARSLYSTVVVVLAVGAVPPLLAQTSLTPSAILSVGCETVKPGMGPAHDRNEVRWARASEAVKGFAPTLAVQSGTGPAVSCWLTGVASYEALGRNNDGYNTDAVYSKAVLGFIEADAAYVSDSRNSIARLRPDLSAGDMPNVLTRRVMRWTEWRTRWGTSAAFEAAVKAYRAAATRAGTKPEFRVYQVMEGAVPAGTYWVMSSTTGMAGFDALMTDNQKIGAAYSPEDMKLFDEASAKSVVSSTSNIWYYSSSQSALTSEQRATDVFWKLKAPAAKP